MNEKEEIETDSAAKRRQIKRVSFVAAILLKFLQVTRHPLGGVCGGNRRNYRTKGERGELTLNWRERDRTGAARVRHFEADWAVFFKSKTR